MLRNSHSREKILIIVATTILLGVCSANAQQSAKNLPRIGLIATTAGSALFRLGLGSFGYLESKNILIEHRNAEGRLDRVPGLVNELIQQKVDVIVVLNNVAIRAAKEATKDIPVVMITSVDPVTAGYVQSFARPGGNVTGIANLGRDLSAKRVELLRELLPKMSRVGILWDADGPGPAVAFKEYMAAANAFKLEPHSLELRGPTPDLPGAFLVAKTTRLDAVIVVANPLLSQHTKQIFELATKNHLPSMTEGARYVNAGGLMSYGANLSDLYRRAAEYVVEILKGAKPANLPVKLPEKFEIFVNLKTAKQLGIIVPQHVLVQADKVIQ